MMDEFYTWLRGFSNRIKPNDGFLSISVLSVLLFFTSKPTFQNKSEPILISDTPTNEYEAPENEENCFPVQIDAIRVFDQSECGVGDGSLQIFFTDANAPVNTNQSNYRVELARPGYSRNLVFDGFNQSPITIEGLFPSTYKISVIRNVDECQSAILERPLNSACDESVGFRAPLEACGDGSDKVLYENCENFRVHIPTDLFEPNTFIYVDDDHVGCLAFVNEDCQIQPSTRVYCADFFLEVPFWEFTFFDDDPTDGIPTVTSLKSYTKEDIELTDLQAARIHHVMCNSEGLPGGAVNDAIWGILGQLEDFDVSCNDLCQAATAAIPDNSIVTGASSVIVTYKSPDPNFQDFVEQVTEDICPACYPPNIECVITVNGVDTLRDCSIDACAGDNIVFSPFPDSTSNYSWTGPNGFTSDSREISFDNVDESNAGEYVVTFTATEGCASTKTFKLDVLERPTAEFSIEDSKCNQNNGSITFTFQDYPIGDSLEFSLDNGQVFLMPPVADAAGTVTYGDLSPGIYSLFVRWVGTNCFTEIADVVINDTPAPTVDLGLDIFVCTPGEEIRITPIVIGGNPPFMYEWTTVDGTFTSMDSILVDVPTEDKQYIVSVIDANNCASDRDTVMVNVSDDPIGITIDSVASVVCKGDENGYASVNVSGGQSPYQFRWNDPFNSQDSVARNLPAGTYRVVVTDENGCTDSLDVVINEPELPLEISTTVDKMVDCKGEANGQSTVAATGGYSGYIYRWDNGETTATADSLEAGTHTVTVTDIGNCMVIGTVEITEPDSLIAPPVEVEIACMDSVGTAGIEVMGGTPPYTFLWSDDLASMTQEVSGLKPGMYQVLVTDSLGCAVVTTATITTMVNDLNIAVTANDVVGCNGDSTGSAFVEILGGEDPFNISWSTGATSDTITGLAAGEYGVTVTDGNGCAAFQSFSIGQADSLIVSVANVTNVLCKGDSTGSIQVEVTGGIGNYIFEWSNGINSTVINNLPAGTYGVTVTDDSGCQDSLNIEVTEPEIGLSVNIISSGNIGCGGEQTGSLEAIVENGTLQYSYLWNTGSVLPVLDSIGPGDYSVTVTDGNGCMAIDSITLDSAKGDINIELTSLTNVLCKGDSTGSLTITASGGEGPYSYAWNVESAGDTNSISNLPAGLYSVTVTDANNCNNDATIAITEPDESLSGIVESIVDAPCFGDQTGSISISASGGTPPYNYLWSSGEIDVTTIDGAGAGAYSVTINDNNDCTFVLEAMISEPDSFFIVIDTIDQPLCDGDVGSVKVSAQGGTPDYTYLWNNDEVGDSIGDLTPGMYVVTATDANNCTTSATVEIKSAQALTLELNVSDVSCSGELDGRIEPVITGGTEPYEYLWSTGSTTPTLENAGQGTYSVTITDQNNCTITGEATINEPTSINIDVDAKSISCRDDEGQDGSIDITVTGGSPDYTFVWSNGSTDEDISGLAQGSYTVTVTDANGCTAVATDSVSVPDSKLVGFVNTMIMENCARQLRGMVTANAVGGTSPYSYAWSTGDTTDMVNELKPGNYKVTITDVNGCEVVEHICLEIEQEEKLGGYIKDDQVYCGQGSDPARIENVSLPDFVGLGVNDYDFIWMRSTRPCDDRYHIHGLGWEKIAGATGVSYDPGPLYQTTYFIRLAKKKGESSYDYESNVVEVQILDALEIEVGYKVFTCEGEPIDLTVDIFGNTANGYSVAWSHGLGDTETVTVSPTETTSYSVTVTNSAGCQVTDQVEVVTKPTPNIQIVTNLEMGQDETLCEGETIKLQALVTNTVRSAIWETNGNGSFTTTNGLATEYVVGSQDVENGAVIITATMDRYIGSCQIKSADKEFVVGSGTDEHCRNQTTNFVSLNNGSNRVEGGTSTSHGKFDTDQSEENPENALDALNGGSSGNAQQKIIKRVDIKPNPFMYNTKVGFELADDEVVRFTVRDLNGKTVKTFEGPFLKGYNEIIVNRDGLPYGILYYSIEARNEVKMGRMLLLE